MNGRHQQFARRALIAALLAGFASQASAQRIFYIDFTSGSDSNDGISAGTPWKRAPGDPLASGQAAAMRLAAGDRLLFRGGVRYRGTININRSGTAEMPIVYDGSGWGDRRAIIDGSDMLPRVTACTSQAACLDSPHWQNLRRVAVPGTARWSDWLFNGDHPMEMAQWPRIANYWDYDDSRQMATIPLAKLNDLKAGFIAVPGVPKQLGGGSPVLALFHNTTDIEHSTDFAISDAGIRFTQAAYRPHSNQDNRFSIANSPSEVDAPGKFALSPKDGMAIFWPREGNVASGMSIGSRRPGFVLQTVSHVKIRGFSFSNFASDNREGKHDVISGVPIYGRLSSIGVQIHDNAIRAVVNHTRSAAIRMIRANDLDVRRNRLEFLPWSSAIYVSNGTGRAFIGCNIITRIGRNGIRVLNNYETEITGNRIDQLEGMHGAGINLYLDNRIAVVRGNVITNARRPMTLHGDGGTPYFTGAAPPRLVISGNTMLSNQPDYSGAAISSWGRGLQNVSLEGNFLSGHGTAIRFQGDETNIAMTGNQLVGQLVTRAGQEPITLANNLSFDPEGNGVTLNERASHRWPDMRSCRTDG